MKNLLLTIAIFSFLTVHTIQGQTKQLLSKKGQLENLEGAKAPAYYTLSDAQYKNLVNLKDIKKITLQDGSIAFMIPAEEITVAGLLTRDQLNRLSQAYCSIPLEPGDLCEGHCRSCPEGYVCTSITRPSISLNLEQVQQNDLLTIKEKGKILQGKIALIRPSIKKCAALPSSLRN